MMGNNTCMWCGKMTAEREYDVFNHNILINHESYFCPNCQKRTHRLYYYFGCKVASINYEEFLEKPISWVMNDIYMYMLEQSMKGMKEQIEQWKQTRMEDWNMTWDKCVKKIKKIPMITFGEDHK